MVSDILLEIKLVQIDENFDMRWKPKAGKSANCSIVITNPKKNTILQAPEGKSFDQTHLFGVALAEVDTGLNGQNLNLFLKNQKTKQKRSSNFIG